MEEILDLLKIFNSSEGKEREWMMGKVRGRDCEEWKKGGKL